ncbi:MAG TPA: DoxX family protein [Candidatus Acidoferrum sp.]|nr:DoxX family protein [Candidatus Acidoferrum sp.]
MNLRRVVMWIGRLLLGGIFLYAGYSKLFYPNHFLWPYFMLKLSVTTNISNFVAQVAAFKLLPPWGVQFVAHTLPFTEIILGLLVLIGWRLRICATLLTLIMVGYFGVVLRAYALHMDVNCGCFATPEPVNLKKVLEDAALAGLAIAMTLCAFAEARLPHPWAASAEKAGEIQAQV